MKNAKSNRTDNQKTLDPKVKDFETLMKTIKPFIKKSKTILDVSDEKWTGTQQTTSTISQRSYIY